MNPRKRNPGIVSQLQVKRFHQELASARQKLEEYEILIASLYETLENIQCAACDKCRANFEEFAPPDFAATPAVHQSTTRLPRPHSGTRSGSVESYRSAHSHLHSPSPTSTSLIDESSHRSTATPSPSREIPSISSKPSPTPASNHDLPHAPVLSIRDEPDDWSITFNKGIKPSMNVKLVDVLVYAEEVSCVRFSPDGYYLAVGLDSGQICIHDVRLGKRTCILAELSSTNLPPERDRLWSMSFSPDRKYIATGHGSAIIRVWNIAKKHVRNDFRHRGGVSGVDFSPDGRFVVSAAHDGTVCAWSMRDGSGRIYSYSDSPYYSLRLTPDGRYVTATDYTGELTRIHYRTGQEVKWKCHDRPATIAHMPNGTGLVTGSLDKTLKYWDHPSFLGEIQEDILEFTESLSFTGHTSDVRGVTISADGKWIISASNVLLCVWDSRTGLLQCTMKGHENCIWWVDSSPAGNHFASGGNDGRVAIWRLDSI